MSFNFIVAPGTILKEYMDSRKITQKELARLTQTSERHLSSLINAKVKLSEAFAVKLEKVFTDTKAEFWMQLESGYRLNLLREPKVAKEPLEAIAKAYQFKFVFKGLGYSIQKQAEEMLKLLKLDSFKNAEAEIKKLGYSFMEDGGNKETIYVWLKMCEEELDIQNELDELLEFRKDKLKISYKLLKKLVNTEDFALAEKNIRRYCKMLGIALVILDALPNSRVRGATKLKGEQPVIFLSRRFKRLDTFYFAFIHELSHLMGSNSKNSKYNISLESKDEDKANEFGRNFFIDKHQYQSFIDKLRAKGGISAEDIIVFATKQKVIPSIVLGFLQYDKIISYDKFSHLRVKI